MGNADLEQYYIECLRKDIEKEIGRSICTYSDFDFLSLRLRERIPDAPSVSTLKRLWAYVTNSSMRSRSTLNALARFLGHADWSSYIESLMRDNRVESGFLSRTSLTTSSLHAGDIVELTWNPGRCLVAEYLGDDRFVVRKSENAKLAEGTLFTTLIITKGLPLYCNNVVFDGRKLDDYAAGLKSGITGLRYIPGK